jgi:hypothetical protein
MWTSFLKQWHYIDVSVSDSDRVYVDGVNSQHQFIAELGRVVNQRSRSQHWKLQKEKRQHAARSQPWQIKEMEVYQSKALVTEAYQRHFIETAVRLF